MLRPDWDVRTGIVSAVDDRSLEEIWRRRNGNRRVSPDMALRSPRQEANSASQQALVRDTHLSNVKPLDGVLLQKLFKATVEEKRLAAVEAEISRRETKTQEQVRDEEADAGGDEPQGPGGFYLPPDLIPPEKEKVASPEREDNAPPPNSQSHKKTDVKAAEVAEQAVVATVIPAQVPAKVNTPKSAAKKAADRQSIPDDVDAQPDPAPASQDVAPGKKKKKKGRGKGKAKEEPAEKPPSEHASTEVRSWIEIGEQTVPPEGQKVGSNGTGGAASAQAGAGQDACESHKSASRSSSKNQEPCESDRKLSSIRTAQHPETRRPSDGSGNVQSSRSWAQMQPTAESVASHSSRHSHRSHRTDHSATGTLTSQFVAATTARDQRQKSHSQTSILDELVETAKSWISSGHTGSIKQEDGWIEVQPAEERRTASNSKSVMSDDPRGSHSSSDSRESGHLGGRNREPHFRAKSDGSGSFSSKRDRDSHHSSPRSSEGKHVDPKDSTFKPCTSSAIKHERESRSSSHRSRKSKHRIEDDHMEESESRRRTPSSRQGESGSDGSSCVPRPAASTIHNVAGFEPGQQHVDVGRSSKQMSRTSRRSSQHSRTTQQLEDAYLETTIAENLANSELMVERSRGTSRDQSPHERSCHSGRGSPEPNSDEKIFEEVDRRDWTGSKLSHSVREAKMSSRSASSHDSHRQPSAQSSHRSHKSQDLVHESSDNGQFPAASDPYASRRRHASPRSSKHSSANSFRRSMVGTPIYGIVTTARGEEGLVNIPRDSHISERRSERPHHERPTIFAGKGWISPHPLSRSPTDLASPPQTKIMLPSNANRYGATMTHEEWLAIQEEGLRKHRNFSITESSQTWHARQNEERYRFPGWEARSWIEVEPTSAESFAFSDSVRSDPTVRTLGSQEASQSSGRASSHGQESLGSRASYHPALPTPTPSELLWQEMEEGYGGF